jgi:UDP-N-acetyl-D-mannosaminuronate dehydrogenase
MKKNKHLIIGAGEVGSSLYGVLNKRYPVWLRDKNNDLSGRFEVLHIAYPPVKNFIKITKDYIKKYKPKLVVIHSTVPIGTTKRIAPFAVHSPIRGIHPRLADGIKTFVKYFGGRDAIKASRYFSAIGIKVENFKNPETTELLKILDTAYYAWNIIFAKETKRICDKFGLDFGEVYTIANQDYNDGYKKLGMPYVVRPVLRAVPGKIGGHCLIPNCNFLNDWLTTTIKQRNKKY